MTDIICDFCSDVPVTHAFPAGDFSHPVPVRVDGVGVASFDFNSAGGWAACRVCNMLVSNGDRQRLAERSAEGYNRKYGLPSSHRPGVEAAIREVHDVFWAKRNGASTPVSDEA